jgi:hypothetical protein
MQEYCFSVHCPTSMGRLLQGVEDLLPQREPNGGVIIYLRTSRFRDHNRLWLEVEVRLGQVNIQKRDKGYWIGKTGNRDEVAAGDSRECENQAVLLSVLRRWGASEAQMPKAIQDLKRTGTASLEV